MAWELLPTNYTDAVWSGFKKYIEIDNHDGTVSFQDATAYTQKENSFFGAKDANRMNEAINTIMSMVENGKISCKTLKILTEFSPDGFEFKGGAANATSTDFVATRPCEIRCTGSKVQIKGNITFTTRETKSSGSVTVANISKTEWRPKEPIYKFAPTSGNRIARFGISTAGNIFVDWVFDIGTQTELLNTEIPWLQIDAEWDI